MTRSDWQALAASVDGDVILSDAEKFESVPPVFNARFAEVTPTAVVRCATPEDVAETLSVLRRNPMGMAIRSGGHSFAGHSSTDGLVIDVAPMSVMSVAGEFATIGAGVRLGDVYDVLEGSGVTIPGGTCPSVGIAGQTLGGGLGILGRRFGVTSDRLVSVSIVLSDGRIVECNSEHEADLFWALRGGGAGAFGVVTTLTFRTVPIPAVSNIHVTWRFSEVGRVIAAWQSWAPYGPDELAASLKVTAGETATEPPSVDLYGVLQGSEADASTLVGDMLDRCGDPASIRVEAMTYAATRDFWARLGADPDVPVEPSAPTWFYARSEFFRRPLPDDAITMLVSHFTAERRDGQPRELDFMPWGGAYNRMASDETAFVHRSALFQLKHSAEVAPPNARPAAKEEAGRWVTASWNTVRPWGSGLVFPNFADPDLADWADAYYGTNRQRLSQVKRRYDPDDLFTGPQVVRS